MNTVTEHVPDRVNLKSVDSSTQNELITVSSHPMVGPRPRYGSEGTRRLQGRSMAVDVWIFFFPLLKLFSSLVIKTTKLHHRF